MNTDRKENIIPASSILLLRDGQQGLEVFMVVRHGDIDSFGGALVFPGGKVEASDKTSEHLCRGADIFDANLLHFAVAAIREVFEECGVLLAYRANDDQLLTSNHLKNLGSAWRQKLLSSETDLVKMCRDEGLQLAVDKVTHFAHWITPRTVPKIFDTHFFLSAAPLDQVALHDGSESTDSVWIRPADALREAKEGDRIIVFPTQMTLHKLLQWRTAAEAIANNETANVVAVRPEVTAHPNGRIFQIPKIAGYNGTHFLVNQKNGSKSITINKLV